MSLTDYQIVRGTTTEELETAVREAIAEGWQPFGSLVVLRWIVEPPLDTFGSNVEEWLWLQPMTRMEP